MRDSKTGLYSLLESLCRVVFFFQAEDGIRDLTVTGVQTCALPICTRPAKRVRRRSAPNLVAPKLYRDVPRNLSLLTAGRPPRRARGRYSTPVGCEIGRASCRERV